MSWSLAGAQGKVAMRRDGDGWFVATSTEPTTQIIKPGVSEFRYQELNEHACLATARALGLRAATTSYVEFDGQPAIVVERHDRQRTPDGNLVRLQSWTGWSSTT